MKKISILIAIILANVLIANAGEEMRVVPKIKTVAIGYRSISESDFATKSAGYTFMFDYAWQLSGFHGKKRKSFISVPLGYTWLKYGEGSEAKVLSYGWTVKHNIAKNKKAIPFFGYGLLLNQLTIEGIDGRIMGHQTRFDFGYDFIKRKKYNPFVKLEYSITRYPELGNNDNRKVSAWEIKTGFRF